jgi:hypothetical protein
MRPALSTSSSGTVLALGVAIVAACGSSASRDGARLDTADAGLSANEDGGDEASACIDEAPDACPSPEPSYAGQVQPILQSHCYECHADAGIAASASNVDLGSYDAVYAERGAVLSQLSFCTMPPAVYAATLPPPVRPTPAERGTVLGWLKCRAPDN